MINNLKGKTKIELFNESGEVVSTQVDENITTKLNAKLTEWISNSLAHTNDKYINVEDGFGIHEKLRKVKGSNALRLDISRLGLVVLGHELAENPYIMTYNQKPLGFVNRQVSTDNPMQGNVNKADSGEIVNAMNEVIGHKFVFDFGTHACNGDINCICLADNGLGVNGNDHIVTTDNTDYSNFPGYGGPQDKFIHPEEPTIIKPNVNKTGYCKYSGNSILIQANSVLTRPEYTDFLVDAKNLSETNQRYKLILDDINNKAITINIDNDTQLSLLTYDLATKTFISKKTITVDTGYSNNIIDFGLLGENYLIILKGGVDNKICHAFDMSLAEPTAITIPLSNTVNTTSYYCSVPTFLAGDGGYSCNILYHTDNYGPYFNRSTNLYIDKSDNSIVPLFHKKSDVRDAWTLSMPYMCYPFGLVTDTGYKHGKVVKPHIGIADRAIYSINNLATVVTKDNTNTMKITYEIKWGE